eukprot:3951630-Lingulodinium_polyedra.AAC.1
MELQHLGALRGLQFEPGMDPKSVLLPSQTARLEIAENNRAQRVAWGDTSEFASEVIDLDHNPLT